MLLQVPHVVLIDFGLSTASLALAPKGLGMVRWLGTSMGPQAAQESGSNVVCLGSQATEKVYVALLATFLQRPGGSVESKK